VSLTLSSIRLANFRNYEEFSLEDLGNLTIMVGPNAVGKTNVIEAIQLVTAISSFRNPRVEHLIRDGSAFGRLVAQIGDDQRQLEIQMMMSEGKKKYFLNGKPKKINALKGICPAVVFTPDDLNLVKGSNSIRRDALDAIGGQISENHRIIKRDFSTVITNKKKLLKEDAREDIISALDEVLITCSSYLTCYRVALFKRLSEYLSYAYARISSAKETVTCRYVPSWEEFGIFTEGKLTCEEAKDKLSQALVAAKPQERIRKRCLVGAHADKVSFFIDGKDANLFASQGQQRCLVLAFKIAEVGVIRDILGTQPVLLLDDVMSELDSKRRECLVDFIKEEMQVFITTTNLEYFEPTLLGRAQVVRLETN
jgi:DNA replication and repair protein RecF